MEQPPTDSDLQPTAVPEDAASLNPGARRGVSRRHLIMGAGLLAISGLTFARTPKRRYPPIGTKQYEDLFPRQFGDWRAMPAADFILPPESDLANKLYEHILTRSYQNSKGNVVMFLVAYSSVQIDDVQVHRPEVCYATSGFIIENNQPYDFKVNDKLRVPTRVVLARSTMRSETILYWTRVGSNFPINWSGQRTAMLESNLEGYYPDGLLVRASVLATGNDDLATLTSFYRDLTAHAPPRTMQLLYNV